MNGQIGIYTYNGILFTLKSNEVLINETTWMNLKNLMVSERNHTEKVTGCMIPFS